MSIAFMGIFDVNVIDRIWEFGPLDDISIRVLHRNHPMQLEAGEYSFTVPIGTSLKEIKQKKYGSDKYPIVLIKHFGIQLRKLGKITDAQLYQLISKESL